MRRWQPITLCCMLVLASCATVDKQINEHEWLRKTRDQSVNKSWPVGTDDLSQ
jgi:hypothetical protein